MTLPTDAAERKRLQLYTFMFTYFPDAWLAVVDVARAGNDQHNHGEPLHWAREKSKDQMNAAFNHIFDYGLGTKKDTDGCWHLAKAIWRQMAQLQLDIEAERMPALDRWCITDDDGDFWRKPGDGVTRDIRKAHVYTKAEAEAEMSSTNWIVPAPSL